MAKKQRGPLAAGELEILQLLWDSPGMTLAEAHRAMSEAGREIGYTTVQTRLERLVEKKVVVKSRQRPAVYSANVKPDAVRATMLDSLLNRLTGVVPLFAHLVQDPTVNADDLREMRRMIDAAEERLRDEEPRR